MEIWFSCGTVHLLQVKHSFKNPPGLELEHAPPASMSLATHLLERHHNDEKKNGLCHHSGRRGGDWASICSTSLTQDLGSNLVVTKSWIEPGESENQLQTD